MSCPATTSVAEQRGAALHVDAGQAHLELLREVNGALGQGSDPRSALSKALTMLVPGTCQRAVLEIYEEDGEHTFLTVFDDPDLEQLTQGIGGRWSLSLALLEASAASGKQEPIWCNVTDEVLASLPHGAEHLAVLRRLGVTELLVVPLFKGARVLGALTLGTDGGRRLGAGTRLLGELLGERFSAHLQLEYFGRQPQVRGEPRAPVSGLLLSSSVELERANARLTAIKDSGLLGMFEWDGDGVVVDANDAFLGLLGWSRAEVESRRIQLAQVLSDPRDREEATSNPRLVLEREIVTKEGQRVSVLLGLTSIPEPRGRGLAFVLDITEHRRRAELEALLVGIVSHDLRNPLGVMTMAASMLLAQGLTEPQRKLANRILAAGDKSVRLISDLLDFTAARRSGVQLSTAPRDLHEIVAQAVDDFQTTWPGRFILHERFGDAEACFDQTRVEQIVLNLISNALQHSPPATVVVVETRGESDAVLFNVTNRGRTIPGEMLRQLFAPLRRGANAGHQPGSIGLGLFIVHHLVLAHGGTIDVTSSDLAGTCFAVRLPRAPRAGLDPA